MESTSGNTLEEVRQFCYSLTFTERKCLITLSRSQSIPDPVESPILFEKTRHILDKFAIYPPYTNLAEPLYPVAETIIRLISSPLTSGLVLVYALGVSLSDEQILHGKDVSFTKELLATQTIPRTPLWN